MMTEIKTMTENLMDYVEKLEEVFDQGEKPERNDRMFFEKVRLEIEPYYDIIDRWEEMTKQLIQAREVSIHPQQIDATVKSLKAISLHSYYIDVRKRRYKDIKKSIDYVLELLWKELTT